MLRASGFAPSGVRLLPILERCYGIALRLETIIHTQRWQNKIGSEYMKPALKQVLALHAAMAIASDDNVVVNEYSKGIRHFVDFPGHFNVC